MSMRKIEIMDTTLRDGEQTSGVSFMPHEKLLIARYLLEHVGVDRVEVASARVSEGERRAVKNICKWATKAGKLDNIEVLGFVDGGTSQEWIASCGVKVMNLLTKGSLKHCTHQLGKTPEEHISDIRNTIESAHGIGISINVYAEDWSNGMADSPEYVYRLIDALTQLPVKRIMLPDTLGVLSPDRTREFVADIVKRYPETHFDFHAHNDYNLAVANVLSAVNAGAKGVHTSVNGLGERAGNATLSSVVAALHDQLQIDTNVNEEKLYEASRLVSSYSGIPIASNAPIVGESVFTQVAGVHADGDRKHNLYANALLPERFGRRREYALGKSSGKANILKNLEELGFELTGEEAKRVTARIIELGDKKQIVTREDLPYIVADVLKHDAPSDRVKLLSYMVTTAYGLRPCASLKVEIDGKAYEENAVGDGQYDAFVSGLQRIVEQLGVAFPRLINYSVGIPPGGRTDAFVETVITWESEGREFRTRGFDADQTEAAIKATLKMLNIIFDANKTTTI